MWRTCGRCRVAEVIERLTGVTDHPGHVWYILRDQLRWSWQLTDEAIAAVKAQQVVVKTNRLRAGSAWHDHGFLFVDELGEPFTQSNINHAIRIVGRRAGVERVHAHLLRRTTATYLHARGVPLATIQAILGHATIGYIDATALDTLEVAREAMRDAFTEIRRAGAGSPDPSRPI